MCIEDGNFNYIKDTVNGYIKDSNNKSIMREKINLGTGRENSIKKIFQNVCEITKINKKLINEKKRRRADKNEIKRL